MISGSTGYFLNYDGMENTSGKYHNFIRPDQYELNPPPFTNPDTEYENFSDLQYARTDSRVKLTSSKSTDSFPTLPYTKTTYRNDMANNSQKDKVAAVETDSSVNVRICI